MSHRVGVLSLVTILMMYGCAHSPGTRQEDSRMLTLAEQGYFFVGGRYTKTDRRPDHDRPDVRAVPDPAEPHATVSRRDVARRRTDRARTSWARPTAAKAGATISSSAATRSTSSTSRRAPARAIFTEVYGKTRRPNTGAMSARFTAPAARQPVSAGETAHAMAGHGHPGRSHVRSVFRLAGRRHRRRERDRAAEPRSGHRAARQDRAGNPAHAFAIGPFRLAARRRAAEARQRHPRDRAERPAFLREHAMIGPPALVQGRSRWAGRGALRAGRSRFLPPRKIRRNSHDAAGDGLRTRSRALLAAGRPSRGSSRTFKGIPILIVVSEASYHAPYDHCTSEFLHQAGVQHEFVRLPDDRHPRQRAHDDAREEQPRDRGIPGQMGAAERSVMAQRNLSASTVVTVHDRRAIVHRACGACSSRCAL